MIYTRFVIEQTYIPKRGRREHRITHATNDYTQALGYMRVCREDPETTKLRLLMETELQVEKVR